MATDQIQPALTPEQWATMTSGQDWRWQVGHSADLHEWPETIALANHALPDDDPRKITRERIDALRSCVETYNTDFQRLIRSAGREPYDSPTATIAREAIAALEALLPPDKWAAYDKARADLPNQRL